NAASNIVQLSPWEQLRKTVFTLVDRPPTADEVNFVLGAANDEAARQNITSLAMELMKQPAFYLRLKEIFNEEWLTDAFKPKAKGLRLNLSDFDNQKYFGVTELMQQGYATADSNRLQQNASDGVSQAALELVTYVVKNDLPFSEILTADYQMVNPYSATLFSATIPSKPGFEYNYGENIDAHDPARFVPARLINNKGKALPHAGILTTQVFLGRYPSSPTNRNRGRAKQILDFFLDTNAENLASRANLDLHNLIGQFPTLQDPQCKVCHDVVDPIAGLFKNWNVKGRFLGNNLNWFDRHSPPEMLAPGLNNALLLPEANSVNALQWLAQNIVADERFITSITKLMFSGFIGSSLTNDPLMLQQLKTKFVSSGLNLRALILEVLTSDYFTTKNTSSVAVTDGNYLGTANLLSPARLGRKIQALFPGYSWVSPGKNTLNELDTYRLLYGGIDSVNIVKRTTEPTAFINGIQLRLANQISCEYVPQDFNRIAGNRVLFPIVDISETGQTLAGEINVRSNIQYLFEYLLGEQLNLSSADVNDALALFKTVVSLADINGISLDCQGALAADSAIVKDSNGTVRAWMAVVNFMLRDYQFYYE
ncbi:MAG: hypothetical protein R3240_03840, partial [Gammaproteobacteria bacterium]|nr:hypothetical protein [Gammaproteobacteria bacterium]